MPQGTAIPLIELAACPKGYTKDSDKAVSPADTVARVLARLDSLGSDILRETKRVDVGRLGIPVFLSVCGADARKILPTRKQMGKGASEEQARASALMELMERYSFFSFWGREENFVEATWSEAQKRFGSDLMPIGEINRSVHDTLSERDLAKLMDLVRWKFYPATKIAGENEEERQVWIPLDWFRALSEFNGSSCGNTAAESVLQGICELVERHVCALIDKDRLSTPTIDPGSCEDPVLRDLLARFRDNGVELILKDFSLDMPVPTVGAVAWDPSTFPDKSEIVFTAGTSSSPTKAAIRAVTEVAQLAGDFCTRACYEASGLSKFASLEEIGWLKEGGTTTLSSLPSIEDNDIREEVRKAVERLKPLSVFAVATTSPDVGVDAHYLVIPGLCFRERDRNESVGLFLSRIICETQDTKTARRNMETVASVYPTAHFLPFFAGMLAMREGRWLESAELFGQSVERQPDDLAKGLASFYAGYALSMNGDWKAATKFFEKACGLCPGMKEYTNYLGVALFKQERYEEAVLAFRASLVIDKGSVMDLANLGMCEYRLGRLEEAREHLQSALEIDPGIEFAANALAEMDNARSGEDGSR